MKESRILREAILCRCRRRQKTHIVLPVLVQRFFFWRLLWHGCCCTSTDTNTGVRLVTTGLTNGGASAVLLLLLLLLSMSLGSIPATPSIPLSRTRTLLLPTISRAVPSSVHPRRPSWSPITASSLGPLPVGTGHGKALLLEDLAGLLPLGLDGV